MKVDEATTSRGQRIDVGRPKQGMACAAQMIGTMLVGDEQ
jgi:hypothetical protein